MSPLSEDELRALVRESVVRLRSAREAAPMPPPGASSAPGLAGAPAVMRLHASHVQFRLGPGGDDTGACIIEPSVPCTHCGFCQSFGH